MTDDRQVLFLDDDRTTVEIIRRVFAREPYGILATTDIEQARQTLAREKTKVVVSDYLMPGIHGVEFLQEVKTRYPETVRILLTIVTDFSVIEEAINLGEIYRFVAKPWRTTELLATIRQAIHHYDLIADNRRLFAETKSRKEELEIANRKLVDLYKMQKEFTSTVSHELRTPLASIKTAVDLVYKRMVGDINQEQEEVLGRANRNVDHLKRLVDDILDLTKMEAGKMQFDFEMNDINQVVQEVVAAQQDVAASRGLYVKTQLDMRIPQIPLDSERIIQVLNNLVNNAIKFTQKGGVTVTTRDKSADNHIIVSVSDTGKGIAEKDFPKLFQKFQQLESPSENEEGGTGLGLAICKEIILRHGGKMLMESAVGKGSTFSFILPVEERRFPLSHNGARHG